MATRFQNLRQCFVLAQTITATELQSNLHYGYKRKQSTEYITTHNIQPTYSMLLTEKCPNLRYTLTSNMADTK